MPKHTHTNTDIYIYIHRNTIQNAITTVNSHLMTIFLLAKNLFFWKYTVIWMVTTVEGFYCIKGKLITDWWYFYCLLLCHETIVYSLKIINILSSFWEFNFTCFILVVTNIKLYWHLVRCSKILIKTITGSVSRRKLWRVTAEFY